MVSYYFFTTSPKLYASQSYNSSIQLSVLGGCVQSHSNHIYNCRCWEVVYNLIVTIYTIVGVGRVCTIS